MKKPDYIPADYKGIKIVDSFEALMAEPFGEANAVVLPRKLSGDFNAVARWMDNRRLGMNTVDALYNSGDLARICPDAVAHLRADIEKMKGIFGNNAVAYHALSLRVSQTMAPKFHADSSLGPDLGRFICCYNTPTTEWIRNEDAIDCGDGRYEAREGAQIYSIGVGDIWRMASRVRRKQDAPPPEGGYFIHRTPPAALEMKQSDVPRMLMVAG